MQNTNKAHMEEVKKLIRGFAEGRLSEEELEICERIADKLGRKRSMDTTGTKPNTWAAAIIWAFLRANPPDRDTDRIPQDTLAEYFGIKKSTITNKASQLAKLLRIDIFNPDFTTRRVQRIIPRFYMTENGFVIPVWEEDEEESP
ncbi:MAG: DUF6398 domain-containing protein [candidate division WOR-3 bacterium]